MCGFTGIQTMPPDQALVPPTVSAFSNKPDPGSIGRGPDRGDQSCRTGSQDNDIECLHRGSFPIDRRSFC